LATDRAHHKCRVRPRRAGLRIAAILALVGPPGHRPLLRVLKHIALDLRNGLVVRGRLDQFGFSRASSTIFATTSIHRSMSSFDHSSPASGVNGSAHDPRFMAHPPGVDAIVGHAVGKIGRSEPVSSVSGPSDQRVISMRGL
jgi:hypothetical protein